MRGRLPGEGLHEGQVSGQRVGERQAAGRGNAAQRPVAATAVCLDGRGRTDEGTLVARDISQNGRNPSQDLAFAEAAFTRMWARWERVIGQLGGMVPATQLRALLIIDDSGSLTPGRLAVALGISPSGASRLSDRMVAAGLLGSQLAAGRPLEITLVVTEAGRRLAGWIRERRRAVLAHELESMSADGRQALARGLSELAGHQAIPPRDAAPPGTHT